MAHGETYNEQTKLNAPRIFELLSELEKRDKANKGAVQSGSVIGAGLEDPRGYAVVTSTANTVGKVVDLYVDTHTRLPHFAIVSLGGHTFGIGNRSVLVGFDDLEIAGNQQVQIRTTMPAEYMDMIESATDYEDV